LPRHPSCQCGHHGVYVVRLGETLPDDLEDLRVIRDTWACAVGIGTLECDTRGGELLDHLPCEAADDAARRFAWRVKGVESVEDRRGCATQERKAIHQQRACPLAGGADRSRAAR